MGAIHYEGRQLSNSYLGLLQEYMRAMHWVVWLVIGVCLYSLAQVFKLLLLNDKKDE